MKIFLTAKYPIDEVTEDLYQMLLDLGFEVRCFAREVTTKFDNPKQLMEAAAKMIKQCDALVLDSTEKSWGRSIEAGIAYQSSKIIIVIQKGGVPGETVLGIANQVWQYEKISDLRINFQKLI